MSSTVLNSATHGIIELREERPATRAPFILVTGGKGGVGKTTIAANLGVALGRSGTRPVLVDLDFDLANLDVMLNVTPRRTLEHYLAGEAELSECLEPGPGGVRLLAAGGGELSVEQAWRDGSHRRMRLAAGLARVDAGIVVGDSAAGIGGDVLDFALLADRVLVVTQPDPAAVTDAFGVIKAVDSYAQDLGIEVPTPEVFVNCAAHAKEARGVASKLAAICERFLARSPRFVGWMARSRGVQRAVSSQRTLIQGDGTLAAARSLSGLAKHYMGLGSPSAVIAGTPNASLNHGR